MGGKCEIKGDRGLSPGIGRIQGETLIQLYCG